MELARAYQAPAVLTAAAELDVFSKLAERPRTGSELAAVLKCDERGLTVLLDALAALRLLEKHGAVYAPAPGVVSLLSESGNRSVAAMVRQLPKDRVLATAGRTTVREMAAVLRKLDLFLSVDTGPAHMAAAVAVPLVVLWGPAIYEQVRPLSPVSPVRILRIPPQCAPCYGTERKKTCKRNVCMENITPDLVLTAARDFLPDLIRR